jgi:hypothetical protein
MSGRKKCFAALLIISRLRPFNLSAQQSDVNMNLRKELLELCIPLLSSSDYMVAFLFLYIIVD